MARSWCFFSFGLIFLLFSSSFLLASPRIVAFGDSLTAGYGLAQEEAYPNLLQEKLRQSGFPEAVVVNAGVSSDTTRGGAARADWILLQPMDFLVLALGSNDGLRGHSVSEIEKNLAQIIEKAQKKGVKVVLAGMLLPSNYGEIYREAFASVYPRLAKRYNLPLIPFLLEGVATKKEFNLMDGVHPNQEGQKLVMENVFKVLHPLL